MTGEVKFKSRRCFEGQWEGLMMMGRCLDATSDRGEPELSRQLQFSDTLQQPQLCVMCSFIDTDRET